jgi:heme iron utilization protein
MPNQDPVQPATPAAIATARALLAGAPHAALAMIDAATLTPGISRIAFGLVMGAPTTLISSLAAHATALQANPACAFMLGEPGPKGDPLTHPRLMVQATAIWHHRDDPGHDQRRSNWLAHHPKAALYIDFADFAFVTLRPVAALLNAGFGKAYRLAPAELIA